MKNFSKKILFSIGVLALTNALFCQTYNTVSTFAGTGVQGLYDAPLASAQFRDPYNACMDPLTGILYVADTYNNAIRRIHNGIVTTLAGNGAQGDVDAQGSNARLYYPTGMDFYNGCVYFTDNGNDKIKKVDTLGNVTTVAGNGNPGYLDGPVLSAQLWNPTGLDVDVNGDIYVADYANDAIRKISGGNITTIAGVGATAGDQTGNALSALFNYPSSVRLDGQGNLYITDQNNNKIKVLSGGVVSVLAGNGTQGLVDGSAATAEFYHPGGMVFDLWGNLIVNDGGNNAIRRITPAGVTTTIAGGTAGYVDGAIGTARFNACAGVCRGLSGEIYVGDKLNHVIRVISVGDVGINQYSAASSGISLFPNPASGYVTFQDLLDKNNSFKIIRILGIDGKLLDEFKPVENAEVKIDVSQLPAGMYFISAISADNKIYSAKFIKE